MIHCDKPFCKSSTVTGAPRERELAHTRRRVETCSFSHLNQARPVKTPTFYRPPQSVGEVTGGGHRTPRDPNPLWRQAVPGGSPQNGPSRGPSGKSRASSVSFPFGGTKRHGVVLFFFRPAVSRQTATKWGTETPVRPCRYRDRRHPSGLFFLLERLTSWICHADRQEGKNSVLPPTVSPATS